MKRHLIFSLGVAIIAATAGCSSVEPPIPIAEPVTETHNNANSYANAKALGPDLIIEKFDYQHRGIGDGAGGWVWGIKLIESNVGNQPSTSAGTLDSPYDQIKIYQRIPIGAVGGTILGYQYSLLMTFNRPQTLEPADSYTVLNSAYTLDIWVGRERLGARGYVDLVAVADGGSTINELNESNNMSPVLRLYPRYY